MPGVRFEEINEKGLVITTAAGERRTIKADRTDIPAAVKEAGIEFTPKEIEDFIGVTAARLLRVK